MLPILNSATIHALRPHQWLKNLLVFLPLAAAHRLTDQGVIFPYLALDALLVFFAFSACASSAYVINDISDRAADREHPVKRHRPFAAGTLTLPFGVALVIALGTCGLGLSLLFPWKFTFALALYLAVTTAYSLLVKQLIVIDIITLAGLYTLRILGAGSALAIQISPWLLAFSMFFFLSLAAVKRATELRDLRQRKKSHAPGRGYSDYDLESVLQCGICSGYIAALVLVLYVNDPSVTKLYASPHLIWCVSPLLVYWISRLVLLANRGTMDADPLLFALRDRVSYLVGGASALLLLAATF